MMRLVMAAVCAFALSACTPDEDEDVTPEAATSAIAAPTPAEVTVRITADQDGQTVQVPVNERFAVELVGVPTAGYAWTPATVPDFVQRAGEASGPTTEAQTQPGFVGGNHWEVLMFVATGPGTGELVIEQRRPWETDTPASQTFRVTIVAQ